MRREGYERQTERAGSKSTRPCIQYVLCSASKSRSTAMEQKTRRAQNPAEPTHTRVGALLPLTSSSPLAPRKQLQRTTTLHHLNQLRVDATQKWWANIPTAYNLEHMPSSSTSKCSRYFFLLVPFRVVSRARQHGSILRFKKKNRNRKKQDVSLVLGKVIKFSQC